jgi:hypothetical protein
VKLITHLQLVPKSRKRSSIHPLPLHVVMLNLLPFSYLIAIINCLYYDVDNDSDGYIPLFSRNNIIQNKLLFCYNNKIYAFNMDGVGWRIILNYHNL